MKDSHLLKNAVLTIIPNKSENRFSKSTEIINELLSRYFIGLVFQISILFIIYTITLLIFGINNAVVIAFLCALLNLIPYIGPMIGQPFIFSKTTKSHPLEIFLIIIIGGLLFGVIGMITAVPLYTAIKVILKEFLSDNKIVKSLTKDI